MENKARYRNVPLTPDSLRSRYIEVIEKQFPKLLDRPDVSLEDKAALRRVIHEKAHFPYIFRHEFSTYWAPKLPRMVFNQVLGHSPNSRMQDFYIHEMGDEGVMELEIAKGIRTREETISPAQIELQPKYCPICHEANLYNAKFCFKCNYTISLEGDLENREKEAQVLKEAQDQKKQIEFLTQKYEIMNEVLLKFTRFTHGMLDMFEDAHKGGGNKVSKGKIFGTAFDALNVLKASSGLNESDSIQILFEALKGNRREMNKKLMQARHSKSISEKDNEMLRLMDTFAAPLRNEKDVVTLLKEYDAIISDER